jgi:hypothetical protein
MFPDKSQHQKQSPSMDAKKENWGKKVLPLMLIQIEFFFLLLRLVQ